MVSLQAQELTFWQKVNYRLTKPAEIDTMRIYQPKAGLSLGAYFSVHADTLRKKATHEALTQIPQANLLFETDADETFCKTHALNDSATSKDVAEMLATTLEKTMSEI